ncbi:MAG TPA: TRAP transporter TatT component family protein [Thermoanaerobaculia bacterium]
MSTPSPAALRRLAVVLALALAAGGCSAIRRMAVNSLADSLSASGDVYTSDDDPELVGDALPFALKTMETLLAEAPRHRGLLLSTCQGFTQYAYAFVAFDLPRLEVEDYRFYREQRDRARRLYLRARDYCFRGLEEVAPGVSGRLRVAPEEAVDAFAAEHVPLLFWTGSSWGSAIGLGLDQPELVADAPAIRALLARAMELEPAYGRGILHEAMIVIEALPEEMGGSIERAREHYDQVLELRDGRSPSTWLRWAETVSVRQQDREEFERLLNQVLETDPDEVTSERLLTILARRRARMLLDLAADLFI